jgi:hypothetical protein
VPEADIDQRGRDSFGERVVEVAAELLAGREGIRC